jgi:NitT/TauT family transport system substrate-binding protein
MKKYLIVFILAFSILVVNAEEKKQIIKIGHYGATCESAIFMAYEQGFFKAEGLDVELYKGDYNTNKEGLALGKLDFTDGVLQQWLKPVEQGLDIKFTLGCHTGCLSGVVLKDSKIKSIKDLKGKTIGISGGIGGGVMNFAYRVLFKAGLDPRKDVQWKDYPSAQIIVPLENGEVDAVFSGDVLLLTWEAEGKVRFISSMAKDPGFKDEICCLLGVRGEFLKKYPKETAAVTRAVLKGARWVDTHREETAKILVDKQYVLGTVEKNIGIIKYYSYNASVAGGEKALTDSVNEFKKLGLIDGNINTAKLVKSIYVKLPGVEK